MFHFKILEPILLLVLALFLFSCGSISSLSKQDLKDSPAKSKGQVSQQPQELEIEQTTGLIDLRSNPQKAIATIHPSGNEDTRTKDLEYRRAIENLKTTLKQASQKAATAEQQAKTSATKPTNTTGASASQPNQANKLIEGRTIVSKKPLTAEQIDEVVALALLGIKAAEVVTQPKSTEKSASPLKQAKPTNKNRPTNVLAKNNLNGMQRLEDTNENLAYLVKKSSTTPTQHSFKSCDLERTKFTIYDSLTKLATTCQWKLPFIAKLNQFESGRFVPQQSVILPAAIFKSDADSAAIATEKALTCQHTHAQFTNFTQVKNLSNQCGWRNRDIMMMNRLTPQELVNIQQARLVLPPLLNQLRSQHQQELTRANPTAGLSPTKPVAAWCAQETVTATKDYRTIGEIANICHLDAQLLARLNQKKLAENILNKTVRLPRSMHVKQKKRSYKYPINPAVCNDRVYKTEFAASISKLIATCDWGFKALLKLNNLTASDHLLAGQTLILPASLYLKNAKGPQNSQPSANQQRYESLCQRRLYALADIDNPLKLNQACHWNFSFFAIINQIDTSISPLKIPREILLPRAVDEAREALHKQEPELPIKPDNLVIKDDDKRIRLCTQMEYPRNNQVDNIISLCGWNKTLIHRLNSQTLPATDKVQAVFYSPLSIFEKFGGKTRWIWPIDNTNIIQPLENQKLLLKSVISQKIRSVQPGVVIYKHRNSNDLIDLAVMHENNFISIYQNMNQSSVKPGSKITASQVIGQLSSQSNGLIFSLLKSGENQDALRYLNSQVN